MANRGGFAGSVGSVGCLVLLGLAALGGCGGGQTRGHPLDSSWSDDDGSELAAFEHEWSGARAPSLPRVVLPSVAVGVVDGHMLVGKAFGRGAVWRYEHELEGRPFVSGTVVVGMGGGYLFALDAISGEELWQRKSLGKLRGVSDDGATTLVSIASLSGQRSIVLAIARDGIVRRQIFEQAVVGSPAVLHDHAFLPWNDHLVVIFDLVEGSEAARVVSLYPVSHAFIVGDQLYFGERSVVRFDAEVVDARRGGGTRVELPDRWFPNDPQWRLSGAATLPLVAARHDSVRYYARPRDKGDTIAIDRYVLSYYRLAIGLAGPAGTTRWARLGEAAFIGGAAGDGSVALCDASGQVSWLDLSTGATLASDSLGESLLACVVQSDHPPGDRREAARPPPPLVAQLHAAVAARQRHLVPIQLELLGDLDAINGDAASAALVDLSRGSHDTPAYRRVVREAASERLSKRASGVEALVVAAAEPYERGQPIIELAQALARAGVTKAAQPLAAQLNDPRWSAAELGAIAAGLERLATIAQRPALALFVGRIRCHEPVLHGAMLSAARTLVRLGGSRIVTRVASEGCEDDAMKASLQAAVNDGLSYPRQ